MKHIIMLTDEERRQLANDLARILNFPHDVTAQECIRGHIKTLLTL